VEISTNLHQSLEELNYTLFSFGRLDGEFHTRNAVALTDILRQCSNLTKVSLLGDALHSVNLSQLLPYGHLFHELQFISEGRTIAYGQAISNLLVNCCNLRKIFYCSSDDEQDSLFFIAIRESCPFLEDLQLLSFSFNQEEHIADTALLSILIRNCAHRRALTFYHCELSARSLRSIATGMEALKELTLAQCKGLTDPGMAVLATMKLAKLTIEGLSNGWTEALLQCFVGSNISQTLESFSFTDAFNWVPIDDAQVATALASCRNLKTLYVDWGKGGQCSFGRNGLDGLQAMAAGCPLLADVTVCLTLPGLHHLAALVPSLKKCVVLNTCVVVAGALTPEGFPSIKELQTLYPAVEWCY
jgi:hypothetical protein